MPDRKRAPEVALRKGEKRGEELVLPGATEKKGQEDASARCTLAGWAWKLGGGKGLLGGGGGREHSCEPS